DQPAQPGARKAIVDWIGPVGTGARLADSLGKWSMLAFEVTEDPSELVDGERFSHTPELGMWRGQTGASGDVVVAENRLRHLMSAGPAAFHSAMEDELGTAWDRALEPLRGHPAAAAVTWLSRSRITTSRARTLARVRALLVSGPTGGCSCDRPARARRRPARPPVDDGCRWAR